MKIVSRVFLFLVITFLAGMFLVSLIFRDRRPQIYFAAKSGNIRQLAQHVAQITNVNELIVCYISGHRYAPLLSVVVNGGHPDAVEFLLKHGANPNQFDSSDHPPLSAAIGREWNESSRQILEMLLKAGADPNLHYGSEYHYTPLIDAASLGQLEAVRILLSNKADVSATNKVGQTALHLVGRNTELAQVLITAGANPQAPDADGSTPMDYMTRDGYTNTLVVLSNALLNRRK